MDQQKRNKRIRLLLKKFNKDRKKQAKQIDILCNDFIGAQRDFIQRLKTISFTAGFYESIVGTVNLNELLSTSAGFIKGLLHDTNVAFFLSHQNDFEVHLFENTSADTRETDFEQCFTAALVEDICRSNKICSLEDLLTLGLQYSPSRLNKISAVTMPLSRFSSSAGFILIYRSPESIFPQTQLDNISAITAGLSQAIAAAQQLAPSPD